MKRPPPVDTEWHWERAACQCVNSLAADESFLIRLITESQTRGAVSKQTADDAEIGLDTRRHTVKATVNAVVRASLRKRG